jgi:hypothetical protein
MARRDRDHEDFSAAAATAEWVAAKLHSEVSEQEQNTLLAAAAILRSLAYFDNPKR